MFGSKDKPSTALVAGTSLIAKGTEVTGEVKFSGNLEVEGVVQGNVVASEGAENAQVRIQPSGKIIGDVVAPVVIVNSCVEGNIYSAKRIELAAQAIVCGDLHYQVIEMVKGAQINGSMLYAPNAAPAGQSSASATDVADAALSDKQP